MLVALGEIVVQEIRETCRRCGPVRRQQRCASEQLARGGQQRLRHERLGHVLRRARGQRRFAARVVARVVRTTTGTSRELGCRRNELQHVHAVHVRHVEVENHERHRAEGDLLDRIETVGGFDEIERLQRTQRGAHHFPDGRRIVDDQDSWHYVRKTYAWRESSRRVTRRFSAAQDRARAYARAIAMPRLFNC